jgi:hypothetical protein
MRVLFDQATPLPIRAYLDQHVVSTASQQGWDTLRNGDLLTAAEEGGFILLTTDKNMPYQQILAGRKNRRRDSRSPTMDATTPARSTRC